MCYSEAEVEAKREIREIANRYMSDEETVAIQKKHTIYILHKHFTM